MMEMKNRYITYEREMSLGSVLARVLLLRLQLGGQAAYIYAVSAGIIGTAK